MPGTAATTAQPSATVQLLSPEGTLRNDAQAEEYLPYIQALTENQLREFHRHMVLVRSFDIEATNLQRQGQLALWVPSLGQEAAQVGSGFAARPQDHIFPAYREHVVGMIRGIDPVDILRMLRGVTHGGWDPAAHNNFHLYTLVIGSHALHATGYAMGVAFDAASGTGDPDVDQAVLVYFGDGATSQGDVSEAFVFASSYNTPQVFFLQNNHWAISVPVTVQSRTPLYLRSTGFGIPGIQIDGNDVLASYAVTTANLDAARSGAGPRFIEALTYRIGPHTTSDDPSKYRDPAEFEQWRALDPLPRFEAYLRGLGEGDQFFAQIAEEGKDLAADVRRRTLEVGAPEASSMFANVYSEEHPLMTAQQKWLEDYEAGLA
ncbi:thiamine pyrophosphate-dependent dehydrogenase E1 component subunit alpha [Desertivibrio insolitus]|uniref:thiamine pyrophosphate-dependent dehydrogenase E1 component subunit alpha n=1 Tax=Herbiconiux sp. SYSU D00978 TaxID=2812562 RepID=UPI001A9624C9|nr:thiamine pyrophosphate-dependent dehydrogenase E1 component subunit alpha [Herbiconiux sp. SYSU D00978]